MTISVGDTIPDVELFITGENGRPAPVRSSEALGKGKVVLFAVPGAFTPGCSNVHLPGFIERGAELKAKGVDVIACVAVNDAFVMKAWGEKHGAGDIVLLSDGNAAFTEAMGQIMDGSGVGLGRRSKRYAAVIEDGVVTQLEVEDGVGVDVSSCANILLKL